MNTYGHILGALLSPDAPKSKAIFQHLGVPTELGGVPTDFDHDEDTVLRKLAQLPDDDPGILLSDGGLFGPYIMNSPDAIPANRCIINVESRGPMSELHCSPMFSHREEIESVAMCLGLLFMPAV